MSALSLLIPLIQDSESCRLKAYRCPAEKWTVGWGQTGGTIKEGTAWTQKQADEALEDSARGALREATVISPILDTSGDSRLAAIADFIYNAGPEAYRGSTLRTLIDAGNWTAAQMEIQKWVHAHAHGKAVVMPGLVIRRAKEAELLAAAPGN